MRGLLANGHGERRDLARKRGGAVTGLGALVLLLAACGTSSAAPGSAYAASPAAPVPSAPASAAGSRSPGTTGSMTASAATLTIRKTALGDVLANARGHTLYWYAKDRVGGPSTCTGPCAAAWPAVRGEAAAARGVRLAGKLGSVRDGDGIVQATYDGHPLYTYAQDLAPGQTYGNGVGGVWHLITGADLATSASSGPGPSGSGAGSSGYGSSGSSGG